MPVEKAENQDETISFIAQKNNRATSEIFNQFHIFSKKILDFLNFTYIKRHEIR